MRDIEIDWFEFSIGKKGIRCKDEGCLFFGEVHAKRDGHSRAYEPPPGLYERTDTPT